MDPRRRRRRGRPWVAALGLTLVSCTSTCSDTTKPGAIGELGNGDFLYECGGQSDPVCEFSAEGDVFPECIALHGQFDLEYRLIDSSALENDISVDPVLYIESVNQNFFSGTDDYTAERVGEAAFIVRESEHVLDLIHIRIVEPSSMEIVDTSASMPLTEVDVNLGSTRSYRVIPRTEACPQLGGAVPFTANSSDEQVATVRGSQSGDLLRIDGLARGTAVIRVQLGDLELPLTVNVVNGPADPSDTGVGSGDDDSGGSGDDDSGGSSGDPGSDSDDASGGSSTGNASTGGM